MKEKLNQLIGYIMNFSKIFFPILLSIEAILGIIFQCITNLSIINSPKFAHEFGVPSYVFIWIIFPITLALFLTYLRNYYTLENNRNFFIGKNIIISLIAISFWIVGGVFSYKNSHTTSLNIVSSKPINCVILKSQNSDREYRFENLNKQDEVYVLPKRITYGGYRITIQYEKGEDAILFRNLNSRSKKITIFEQ